MCTKFSTRAISAIETGRRQVRTDAELQALIRGLGLNLSEAQQLGEAVRASSRRIHIPSHASPRELRLVHQLVGSLGQLQDQQIAQISDALAGGRAKP